MEPLHIADTSKIRSLRLFWQKDCQSTIVRGAALATEATRATDRFHRDSVVDLGEFFVVEEPFEMVEAEGLSKQRSRPWHGRSSH